MFHAKEGLTFGRRKDGSVWIVKRASAREDSEIVMDITLDADMWCSVIASVSKIGETSAKFDEAQQFHNN